MPNSDTYIPEFRKLEKLVYDEIYTISKKNTNILFLGSCRMLMLCMYIKRVIESYDYLKHAQFGFSVITVYHPILNESINKPPSVVMRNVFETADIIICETIKHSKYLNTVKTVDENMYTSFKLKDTCQVIQLPNIEVSMFMASLKQSYPAKTTEELIATRKENIDKLLYYIRLFQYNKTADFIEENIYKQRLFATNGHPMPVVFQIFTQEFVKKLWNIDIDNRIISDINISQFLGKEDFTELDYTTGIDRNIFNYK